MSASQALDDFFYFAKVIEHGSYAAAGRALAIPKSRLSRHVSALEQRLGVRLIQRSTRRFAVTEIGHQIYQEAQTMLVAAQAAEEAAQRVQAEPSGPLKVSCPVAIAQTVLADLLPEFLARNPKVRLRLHATNRRVDVLAEGFDAALRVRSNPSGEDGLVMRRFGESEHLLVASRQYLEVSGRPVEPTELVRHETLTSEGERQEWDLIRADGTLVSVELTARIVCADFVVLRTAALAGMGIALLPQMFVRDDLISGRLERLLSDWSLPQGICHLVFPTRIGMRPAVRAFVDFLAERMPHGV